MNGIYGEYKPVLENIKTIFNAVLKNIRRKNMKNQE